MKLGERLVDKTKIISKHEKTIKLKEKEYQDLHDLYVAEQTGRKEAEDKLALYQKGGVMYCVDQFNFITEAIHFPAYHETTFEQDIPSDITRGYYSVKDGIIERNEEKYKEYIRRVL